MRSQKGDTFFPRAEFASAILLTKVAAERELAPALASAMELADPYVATEALNPTVTARRFATEEITLLPGSHELAVALYRDKDMPYATYGTEKQTDHRIPEMVTFGAEQPPRSVWYHQ